MATIKIGRWVIRYGHPHDLAGAIEVWVLNVYNVHRIPKDAIVIDLGEGIGDFTLAAARRLSKGGLVIAIEPNPADFEILLENTRRNGVDNIVAMEVAIGDAGVTATINFKNSTFAAREVPLEEVLSRAGLSISQIRQRPVVLKMDIEGAELAILPQFYPLLDAVTRIAIELHGTKEGIDQMLLPRGFVFSRVTRRQCLIRALAFSMRHPASAATMWVRFRRSDDYHGCHKILSGIESLLLRTWSSVRIRGNGLIPLETLTFTKGRRSPTRSPEGFDAVCAERWWSVLG